MGNNNHYRQHGEECHNFGHFSQGKHTICTTTRQLKLEKRNASIEKERISINSIPEKKERKAQKTQPNTPYYNTGMVAIIIPHQTTPHIGRRDSKDPILFFIFIPSSFIYLFHSLCIQMRFCSVWLFCALVKRNNFYRSSTRMRVPQEIPMYAAGHRISRGEML